MKTLKTMVLAEGFNLLETPRWHDGALWMSDMVGREVYRLTLDGRVETIAEVACRPSGLEFLPDGTLLVASMRDRRVLRLENGIPACHADLSHLASGEINDMVVDRRGRAYVGSFDWHAGDSVFFQLRSEGLCGHVRANEPRPPATSSIAATQTELLDDSYMKSLV